MNAPEEQPLAGGNVAAGVVRVGDTVRKPAGPWVPAVEALLEHLCSRGFTAAPRSFGLDDRGRQILEYVPGQLAHGMPELELPSLGRVGRIIRELHDAASDFEPPPDAHWQVVIPPDRMDLICHHDLAPWNLVIGTDRWCFIDWDGAGPGSRLWDLAYAIKGFVPLEAGRNPVEDAPRVRAMADGYDLTPQQRRELPPLMVAHTRGMYDLLRDSARTGAQPWARLYAEGHGDYWGAAADYIEANLSLWAGALSDD
jgi:Ser/Thr protein kinase RdoA (MazF antagonist)